MTAFSPGHTPIVLLGDVHPDQLVALRQWLDSRPRNTPAAEPAPAARITPALPAEATTPGLLDIIALRASHFAHGHTIEGDLERRDPGVLAKAGRTYVAEAIDLLARGPGQRASARIKLTRAAALLLAELDRLDAEDTREALTTRDGEPA